MKLLWLTPEVPERGGSGGAIRAANLLRGLAAQGVDVTVVAPAYAEQAERARPLADAGVELQLVPRPDSRAAEALRTLARHPTIAVRAASAPWLGAQAEIFWGEIEPTVRRVARGGQFDAVIVEHEFVAPWAARVPGRLPAALALQNAYWTVFQRRADAATGARRALARVEAARFRNYVASSLGRYDLAWAVSDDDRRELHVLAPHLDVDLVPNGVEASLFSGLGVASGDPALLIFAGTLSFAPNDEAVRWLAQEILPRVRERRPQTRLRVVGRGATPALERLAANAGVELVGWVADIAAEYEHAGAAVAPIRSGSGTNLKVVEALAAGRPLVATPMAVRGIDVRDGEDLLVAGEPGDFAAAVVRVLDNRDLAARLAASGRARVVGRYDWDALSVSMRESLERWLRL